MAVNYSLPKPTAGTSRATSPTETEIIADVSDTIADVGTRLDAVESATSSPSLLDLTHYRPGSAATHSVTSTTMVDLDATNLAVTFDVPATGVVLVRLEASADLSGDGFSLFWGLREGTMDVPDTQTLATKNSNIESHRVRTTMVVTGLTPGATHTYKWAHSVSTGTGRTIASPTNGGAIMEVWAGVPLA